MKLIWMKRLSGVRRRLLSHFEAQTAVLRSLLLLLVTFAALNSVSAAGGGTLRAGTFDPPRPAPELALQGSNGEALNLSRYRGKVVVLGFGFTSCPEVCPTTLAVLAQARKRLGEQAQNVQIVYVTVDPERDGAERMRKYLNAFDPTFVGGTGSPQRLAEIRKQYGVTAEKIAAGGSYVVAHSSFTYLIDRQGRLRALMPYGKTADDFVHDLKLLLQQ
jgi:protein SCO1